MPKIYILTGSNIGDSLALLQQAKLKINQLIGLVVEVSSIYKTAPWGNTNQQDFLNQVLLVETNFLPEQVIKMALDIEQNMGRIRTKKWAPRIIDIDILFYGDEIINQPSLIVPHPLLHERRFTLAPLAEIAPFYIHPSLQKSIELLLNECPDNSLVEKM